MGLLAFGLVVMEITAFGLTHFLQNFKREDLENKLFRYKAAPKQRTEKKSAAFETEPMWFTEQILHPYIGFVRNPEVNSNELAELAVADSVNAFGFYGDTPRRSMAEDQVAIVITGGSVATELFVFARKRIAEKLSSAPRFSGKRLHFYSLALPGMKQPQQLMALNYFLALGYSFQIVINIDGFNEAVLPYAENLPVGVYPFFPRSWRMYTTKMSPLAYAPEIGQIVAQREQLAKWSRTLADSVFSNSNLVLMLWYGYFNHIKNGIMKAEDRLRALQKARKTPGFQESGPAYAETVSNQIFQDSAALWRRTSIQMWKICVANAIEYYHFLQPNQYVRGSKPFSAWEKRHVFGALGEAYRSGAEQGYPFLLTEGDRLTRAGVPFTDLTRIFQSENETLYRDTCCHYTPHGYDIVAAEIGRRVAGARAGRKS